MSRLQADPAAADEGIFLLPAAGGPALRIPPQVVQRNKPSLLVFLNPPGLSGTYTLEVRARVGRGSAARELRTGRLDGPLTAAAE
ncbi:MAG: DUF4469 domain-containing protein [Phycisphaerales bacterium]|nr:DUF4469 domain-containing protein [Phycisphaerales bacterium]